MLAKEQELANYLSKADEDPFSQALLDVVRVRMNMITDELMAKTAIQMKETTVFHLCGQLFALNGILELPIEAKKHLDSLPEEEA